MSILVVLCWQGLILMSTMPRCKLLQNRWNCTLRMSLHALHVLYDLCLLVSVMLHASRSKHHLLRHITIARFDLMSHATKPRHKEVHLLSITAVHFFHEGLSSPLLLQGCLGLLCLQPLHLPGHVISLLHNHK